MSGFGVITELDAEYEHVTDLQVAFGTAPGELSGERLVYSALVAAGTQRSATQQLCWATTSTKRAPETLPPTETEKVLSVSDQACEMRTGRLDSYVLSQCAAG